MDLNGPDGHYMDLELDNSLFVTISQTSKLVVFHQLWCGFILNDLSHVNITGKKKHSNSQHQNWTIKYAYELDRLCNKLPTTY